MRQDAKQPGEELSEYLDRMLGIPDSRQRRLADSAVVKYYEMLWNAQQVRKDIVNGNSEA